MTEAGSRIPDKYAARLAILPAPLRALLEAELAAGNEIVEVASCFPAPPAGVYVKLARPVTTRPRASGGGLEFLDRNTSLHSGEFHDERRFHFILEPPHPPEPPPDMDAIREGRAAARPAGGSPPSADADAEEAVRRFRQSMAIDYEKWHDGIGYDLAALQAATPAGRRAIERVVLDRGAADWRDVEALAALGTPAALAALERALATGSNEIRLAVMQHAPGLATQEQRVANLVAALRTAELFGGLSQALDEVPDFHPPPVLDALFHGALERAGDVAVHFAAMLTFLHGQAAEPFHWAQRPFFLRFHTEARSEREAAFRELCERIGVDAGTYLKP
ncbi:MAG TPA: hypothetical protein VFY71_11780 [Planctomycetota bacterium]|nr:hypothetical protein [Planctomycetota bacterium]